MSRAAAACGMKLVDGDCVLRTCTLKRAGLPRLTLFRIVIRRLSLRHTAVPERTELRGLRLIRTVCALRSGTPVAGTLPHGGAHTVSTRLPFQLRGACLPMTLLHTNGLLFVRLVLLSTEHSTAHAQPWYGLPATRLSPLCPKTLET